MADYDYRAIADRLQTGEMNWHADAPGIMALLGYEVAPHGRLGLACRAAGERRWQALPSFNSADSFELWVLDTRRGTLDDIGRRGEEEAGFYISYCDPEFGNDYGYAKRIGTAMWAAFINVVGQVDRGDDG